jgi:hypothetical protein
MVLPRYQIPTLLQRELQIHHKIPQIQPLLQRELQIHHKTPRILPLLQRELQIHHKNPSWVEEVLLPSMGAEEAEAAARSAHVSTAAKGLRS